MRDNGSLMIQKTIGFKIFKVTMLDRVTCIVHSQKRPVKIGTNRWALPFYKIADVF